MYPPEEQNYEWLSLTKIRFIFLFLLFLKGWERFLYPGIWAEDGSLFLQQAFESGWFSLFIPYDGYFHTFPRLIALVSTLLPLNLIPYFIVFVCYAIFTFTITVFFASPYRWVFRTPSLTFVAALLLLVSPGQIEMLGNLTNLHWYLLLLLSIIGLHGLETNYRVGDVVIALLCVSTSGASIILLPLFAGRIVLKWRKPNSKVSGEIWIGAAILFFSILNSNLSTASSLFYYPLFIYLKIFVNHFLHFFMFHPFLGDQATMSLHHYKNIAYLFSVIIILFISLKLRTTWEQRNLLVLILCLCALFLPVMIGMARPMRILNLLGYDNYDMHHWFRSRYSFYIPAIASIFWVFFIARIKNPKWLGLVMIAVILFSQVFLNHYRIEIRKYKNHYGWQSKVEVLKQSRGSGCPPKVQIPIDPQGWYFEYNSPLTADCRDQSTESRE